MYKKNKKSFFEKLTGTVDIDDDDVDNFEVEEDEEYEVEYEDEEEEEEIPIKRPTPKPKKTIEKNKISKKIKEDVTEPESKEEESIEGELAIDVYQTDRDIVIQAMIAGVRPEDMSVSITRDVVVIKGKRSAPKNIPKDNYFNSE